MKVNVLTLYPEMFPGCLGYSLVGKALADKKWELNVVNIRDFSDNRYKSVDDTPFGGGAGMIMRADILDKALTFVNPQGTIYYLSPRGEVFCQKTAQKWSKTKELTFVCGRFEGIDERVLEEVIPHINQKEDFAYQVFDCSAMKLGEYAQISDCSLLIVEGSYSHHPAFSDAFDLRVFLCVEEEERKKRITERNAEKSEMFFCRWIPLENRYFETFEIKEKADIVIYG